MMLLALLDADEVVSLDDAMIHGWSLPLVPFIGIMIMLVLYLRGWRLAHRTRPLELPLWRAGAYCAGLLALWMALASPIDALDDTLLLAHMTQHYILMSVAPPLIMLGAPVVPVLRGLPRFMVRGVIGPLLRLRWFHAIVRFVTHPAFIWVVMNVSYLGWHVPAMFELTFASEHIHDFEHLCFFVTSLAFWWVVLAPWPVKPRWPRWTVIPFLLTSDLLNTTLSATLVYSGRVLYHSYAEAPRITSMTALQDQVAAGSGMWVCNSIVFLIPAMVLTLGMMQPKYLQRQRAAQRAARLAELTGK